MGSRTTSMQILAPRHAALGGWVAVTPNLCQTRAPRRPSPSDAHAAMAPALYPAGCARPTTPIRFQQRRRYPSAPSVLAAPRVFCAHSLSNRTPLRESGHFLPSVLHWQKWERSSGDATTPEGAWLWEPEGAPVAKGTPRALNSCSAPDAPSGPKLPVPPTCRRGCARDKGTFLRGLREEGWGFCPRKQVEECVHFCLCHPLGLWIAFKDQVSSPPPRFLPVFISISVLSRRSVGYNFTHCHFHPC